MTSFPLFPEITLSFLSLNHPFFRLRRPFPSNLYFHLNQSMTPVTGSPHIMVCLFRLKAVDLDPGKRRALSDGSKQNPNAGSVCRYNFGCQGATTKSQPRSNRLKSQFWHTRWRRPAATRARPRAGWDQLRDQSVPIRADGKLQGGDGSEYIRQIKWTKCERIAHFVR